MGVKESHKTIRGRFFLPTDTFSFDYLDDAILEIGSDGKIIYSGPAQEKHHNIAITNPKAIWFPGFVDTHIHYPQTRIIGSATGALLTWLEKSVFPEECKFEDHHYAQDVATEFTKNLAQFGTTTAAVFGSSLPSATDILFEKLAHTGLRAIVGLTLMNRLAPDPLLMETAAAMDACHMLTEKWHGYDNHRLGFALTPRFALSCSPGLLKASSDFAAKNKLLIQTHLSENHIEIESTQKAFPKSSDYVGVYDDFGLVNERTLFAHCLWLGEQEWTTLKERKCSIAHCPDSNFFLNSGNMPWAKTRELGIRTGLGTDVGAGRSFSMRRMVSSAFDNALQQKSFPLPTELLWHATRGGALALNLGDSVGLLDAGYQADIVALETPPYLESPKQILETIAFNQEAVTVRETRVSGKLIYGNNPQF